MNGNSAYLTHRGTGVFGSDLLKNVATLFKKDSWQDKLEFLRASNYIIWDRDDNKFKTIKHVARWRDVWNKDTRSLIIWMKVIPRKSQLGKQFRYCRARPSETYWIGGKHTWTLLETLAFWMLLHYENAKNVSNRKISYFRRKMIFYYYKKKSSLDKKMSAR